MLHYLDYIRRFWTQLVEYDKYKMQKIDHLTVKTLELKAPGASTSDAVLLFHQMQSGEIFKAFDLDYRLKIWARLQAAEGLIPTLWTFFEDFKYLQACANCVRRLITVPFRGTLYTAMNQSFSETSQKSECQALSLIHDENNTQRQMNVHYRKVFLYAMRNLRELLPGSTRIELKQKEKKQLTMKEPDVCILYGLADIAERLGFRSPEIIAIKAKFSSQAHAEISIQTPKNKPTFVVDGSGESLERRCACPFILAYEQSKDFLTLDNMEVIDKSRGSSIHPVFVRRSVYLAYFGKLNYLNCVNRSAVPDIGEFMDFEATDQAGETNHKDQEEDPMQEDINIEERTHEQSAVDEKLFPTQNLSHMNDDMPHSSNPQNLQEDIDIKERIYEQPVVEEVLVPLQNPSHIIDGIPHPSKQVEEL